MTWAYYVPLQALIYANCLYVRLESELILCLNSALSNRFM